MSKTSFKRRSSEPAFAKRRPIDFSKSSALCEILTKSLTMGIRLTTISITFLATQSQRLCRRRWRFGCNGANAWLSAAANSLGAAASAGRSGRRNVPVRWRAMPSTDLRLRTAASEPRCFKRAKRDAAAYLRHTCGTGANRRISRHQRTHHRADARFHQLRAGRGRSQSRPASRSHC